MAATFSALSDTDLVRMTGRAWRDAAREWQEARSSTGTARTMLLNSAELADAYWRDLRDEQDRRLEEAALSIPVEVGSSDIYTVLPDGGVTSLPVPAKAPVTSPWVGLAVSHELSSRVEGGIPQPKALR